MRSHFTKHQQIKINGQWHRVIVADGKIAEVAPMDENGKCDVSKKFVIHADNH